MAKGSSQPKRDWFEGQENCSGCGKKLTLTNFGHVRTVYPSNRREVLCLECVESNIRDTIDGNRGELGWEPMP